MREGQSKISAWMDDPENRRMYNEWRNHPITVIVTSLLREEASPQRLPTDATGRIMIEASAYLHGQQIGEERILRRILELDKDTGVSADVMATYNSVQNLIDQGYTEEDAIRIEEENRNA